MFEHIIKQKLESAGVADRAFDAAIKSAGFKSRFDWFLTGGSPEIEAAYKRKLAAEQEGLAAVVRALS